MGRQYVYSCFVCVNFFYFIYVVRRCAVVVSSWVVPALAAGKNTG